MAQKETWTKLFAPDGTPVEVQGEDRATVLKDRGYTTTKPRNPVKPAVQSNDAQAEIDRLTAENEALKAAAADSTPPADPKK